MKKSPPSIRKLSPLEAEKLIADLQAHQIELKMQNEELRRTQHELEMSRDKYSDLFDFAPVGYFTYDAEGVIREVNLTGASMLGRKKASIVGQLFSIFIAPDDQDIFYLHRRRVDKSKEKEIFELRLVKEDGSRLVVEMNCFPSHEQIRAAITDITARKSIEEALRTSEEELAADLDAMTRLQRLGSLFAPEGNLGTVLLEIVDAAFAISGADFGNIQLLDPDTSRLTIVAQRGFPDWWVDYWNGIGNGQGACGHAMERGARVIVEDVERNMIFKGTPVLEIQLKAGVRACQSTPLVSRTGKVLGMFSTHFKEAHRPDDRELHLLDLLGQQAADIIDRARHEEALRRSREGLELRVRERTAELERRNRELQEFAFIASHDLSEPLRKIQTFGDLLKAKSADRLGDQKSDYISRMTGAAARMRGLLDALLTYSRVDTKGQEFRPVKLDDIVKDAATDLEVAIRKIKAQVEVGPMPIIQGDPYQLRQLFQNLIANAVKYHRADDEALIKIYAEGDDWTARIMVADNGIGFDEKYLDKIFQPFQRLHGKHEYPGTGIGLAICKKIAERHGGTITARSTPGKGSTFIVTLPVDGTKATNKPE